MSIKIRTYNLLFYLRHGKFRLIWGNFRTRLYSEGYSYGLKRDLDVPFLSPALPEPLSLHPITPADIRAIFGKRAPGMTPDDDREYSRRLLHIHADIPTCYIGATGDGTPVYMQWMMGAEQNEKIKEFFSGAFPPLAPDEALLENVMIVVGHRGRGIMAAATARVAEMGRNIGARHIITFVHQDGVLSMKGLKKAGFAPYMVRHERWRFFRRTITFTPLPENTPYPFDVSSVSKEKLEQRNAVIGAGRLQENKIAG